MKKLELKLDELAVESFAVTPAEGEGKGTVFAHASTGAQIICECTTRWNENTCAPRCGSASCGGTCGGSGCGGNTWEETCATGAQVICECP